MDIVHVPIGASDSPIWLDDVVCSGNENRLVDCQHADWEVNDCTHYEDVGMSCLPGMTNNLIHFQ